MPHVVVKLVPGRSAEQKTHLAEEITKDVVTIFKCGAELVSVAFEENRAAGLDGNCVQTTHSK
jgi:4-oxalocrotonate tautomerase